PRPPNAFICFRSHFYAQLRTVTQPDDNKALHQTLLSTSAGLVWREMTRDEKAPFVKRAEEEKKAHGEMYPEYQYMP
ncbi:high mobility group box domain-containing protein, partial [Mycena amicta]